jgi:hypothetical protein
MLNQRTLMVFLMKKYLFIPIFILLILISLSSLFIGKHTKKIIIKILPKQLELISYESSLFNSHIVCKYLDNDNLEEFNIYMNIQHGPIIWSKENNFLLPALSLINYEAYENKQKDNDGLKPYIHGSFKLGFDQKGIFKGNLSPYFTKDTPSSLNIPKDLIEASFLAEGSQKGDGILINKINVQLSFNSGNKDYSKKTNYSLQSQNLTFLNNNSCSIENLILQSNEFNTKIKLHNIDYNFQKTILENENKESYGNITSSFDIDYLSLITNHSLLPEIELNNIKYFIQGNNTFLSTSDNSPTAKILNQTALQINEILKNKESNIFLTKLPIRFQEIQTTFLLNPSITQIISFNHQNAPYSFKLHLQLNPSLISHKYENKLKIPLSVQECMLITPKIINNLQIEWSINKKGINSLKKILPNRNNIFIDVIKRQTSIKGEQFEGNIKLEAPIFRSLDALLRQ